MLYPPEGVDAASVAAHMEHRVVQKGLRGKSFSIFRSAGEGAEERSGDRRERGAEGGHMSCSSGRIVSTPWTDCLPAVDL